MDHHSDQFVLEFLIRDFYLDFFFRYFDLFILFSYFLLLYVSIYHTFVVVRCSWDLFFVDLHLIFLLLREVSSIDLVNLIKHEFPQVQLLGELEPVVDFLVGEGLHVEDDAVQVHDHGVGESFEHCFFGQVDFLFAVFTVEIVDGLSIDHVFESRVDIFLVFHLD